jgi:hypothetical protein
LTGKPLDNKMRKSAAQKRRHISFRPRRSMLRCVPRRYRDIASVTNLCPRGSRF